MLLGYKRLKKLSNTEFLIRNQAFWLGLTEEEEIMKFGLGRLGKFSAGVVIFFALLTAGCAHRYYDADHNDYHRWNHDEIVYYQTWSTQNHIDRDYRHLSREDQQRYWDWRHSHDHDRDRDRDHDHDNDRH